MVETAQAGLLIQGGPNSGRTVSLSGRPNTLSRWSDNDVIVDETTVSRRHALIMETPGGFALWDSFQGSTESFDIYQVFVGVKTQGSEVESKRGSAGRKWVTSDETTFLGNTGPATLLIIADDEKIVDTALQQLTEALQEPTP